MGSGKNIALFFWSSVLFEKKARENYGDLLSKFIVEKVSRRSVKFYNAPKKKKSWFQSKHLLAIGSILSYATEKSHVWGSGIISKKDTIHGGTFHAVRGPHTRSRVRALGFDCPEVYGDPALLLPKYIEDHTDKTYKIGIIPHYVDYEKAKALFKDRTDIKVIDLITDDLELTTKEILSCERTLSSSLHGVIVSHAYGIPSVWIKLSDKLTGDNIKFADYFESVGLAPYDGKYLAETVSEATIHQLFKAQPALPERDVLKTLNERLINAFPEL